ncbi:ROK family protein [Phaeodactylibacter luteus]|uniref:ROK family protein n=1 Tax=Phaeodactylibacter luteus TaxID=1564516 RepID=A0A5C6RHJ6_9BACT|nr:ROK family protein [Phaeodactylibacter luteus]TXB61866.1 ROK family protein [Phaeodactylibacter luteus]
MKNQLLWGIDLGGTKIEGAIIESISPLKVRSRLRVPTEKEKGYEHIIGQIEKVIRLLIDDCGERPDAIGIGTPGTTDPDSGLIKNANAVVLNGKPLHKDLEARLGIPVAMANDANCFAIAEARLGKVPREAPNAQVVFGVIMGTGVGGGVVINGQVRNGRQGIAGEWGHNFLDDSGGPCYCGLSGCVETVISGPALERFYEKEAGQKRSLKEIMARLENDKAARATLDRLLHFFGKGIASVINVLDPDAIVLGGGLGNIPQLYTEGVEAARHFTFNHRLDTRFLAPELGDSAGVFGAAMLVADR